MRKIIKRKILVSVGWLVSWFVGLASGANAQTPTTTPGVAPTPTPPPTDWWASDKAPWVVTVIIGVLGLLGGLFIRPLLERWAKTFDAWTQSLSFRFEKNYLNALKNNYGDLKLVGVRYKWMVRPPKLEEVYVSLQIGSPPRADDATPTGEMSLGDALAQHNYLVILGEPGAGKSTMLRYLVLVFTGGVPFNRLGLKAEPRLPIYIRLKDCVEDKTPIAELVAVPPTLPVSKSPLGFFERRLQAGKCIVLLDGLDEVVDDAHKKIVSDKIKRMVADYPGNRYVITCRTAGWHPNLAPGNFVALKIRDLNSAQVTRFIHDWYKAVITNDVLATAGKEAEKQAQARQQAIAAARPRADDLVAAIEAREALARLSKNPLILSLIALVHYHRSGELPQRRARLYGECLDVLLELWDRDDKGLVLPDAPSPETKMELAQEMAYYFQTNGVDEADAPTLCALIAPILNARQCRTTPDKCLQEQMVERSGLLAERAIGRYGFAHRTLQEYLTAKSFSATPEKRAELVKHLGEEPWREVILLYVGLVNSGVATSIVREILALPDNAAHATLLLAGQCLAEDVRVDDAVRQGCLARLETAFHSTTDAMLFTRLATTLASIGGQDVVNYFERVLSNSAVNVRVVATQALGSLGKRIAPARITPALLTALKDQQAIVRGAAAQSLGQLGYDSTEIAQALRALRQNDSDPGLRATATSALLRLGHASDLSMVKIPAGEFLMGEDAEPHPVYLDEYYIGRYPVTNAEFENFVQAGGYGDAKYWERAIADGWWKDGKFKGRWDTAPRDRPEDFGTPFNLPNHPVVGISWYEATAYAMWAGLRLPSEAEWEKAARGIDGRRYPWGNPFDATRCNSAESRNAIGWLARVPLLNRFVRTEGATTPVGQFSPRGDSPYGVTDMAGNVWEWCADWYDENYYKNSPAQNPPGPDSGEYRVLRGGAFFNESDSVRAAYRGRVSPDYRSRDYGFRVVAGAS